MDAPFETDVVIAGSGVSSLFTLVEMLRGVQRTALMTPLKIVVVDSSGEFNKGVAYGFRSGHGTLCIHSLEDFMPEKELAGFEHWLEEQDLDDMFPHSGVGAALYRQWLTRNREDIEARRWRGLFFPRAIVGRYFDHLATTTLRSTRARFPVSVEWREGEVVDVRREDDRSHLSVLVREKETRLVRTRKLVIAVGGTPRRTLSQTGRDDADAPLQVVEPYAGSFDRLIARIEARSDTLSRAIRVVVAGSNASSAEALYALHALHESGTEVELFVISPSGSLPELRLSSAQDELFEPVHLLALSSESKPLSARDIYHAAIADIGIANQTGIGSEHAGRQISTTVSSLLDGLPLEEQQDYVDRFGHLTGLMQRRIGREYFDAYTDLESRGRLTLIAGRIDTVDREGRLHYRATTSGQQETIEADFVVNCAGFEPLDERTSSALLGTLLRDGEITPNRFGRGISVDDRFECSPGIHVMGPLLAGNIISDERVWHAEHCGRIARLSAQLAKILLEDYVENTSAGPVVMESRPVTMQ